MIVANPAREAYTFKVAPEYTIAYHYDNRGNVTCLDEWSGRTVEDFASGMAGRGFSYTVETYELSGGRKFTEHHWTR